MRCIEAETYRLTVPADKAGLAATWLRDLSDGYVSLNLDGKPDYSPRRLPGPIVVMEASTDLSTNSKTDPDKNIRTSKRTKTDTSKPWFIGCHG